ncbi:hypothetical protein [Motilimonas pumila]|uniref:Uncharacterized protein n=1 Tax=Motilimonas pumila TaxID=2303987 RepID=A0A418YEE3_9GAMM|nr:hypothetical protein [Motilimonas pumila]RJG47520.1 hypothetical protein D1Z90_10290 [Motilimonas pumila]
MPSGIIFKLILRAIIDQAIYWFSLFISTDHSQHSLKPKIIELGGVSQKIAELYMENSNPEQAKQYVDLALDYANQLSPKQRQRALWIAKSQQLATQLTP